MSIPVQCQCGKRFAAKPHLAGKRIKCPSCGSAITIPMVQESPVPSATTGSGVSPGPSRSAKSDIWDDLPAMAAATRPKQEDTLAVHNANVASQLLNAAQAEHVENKTKEDIWGTGQIVSGGFMVVGASLWFGVGLLGGRILIYPPILFITGAIALINGILQKWNRSRGL